MKVLAAGSIAMVLLLMAGVARASSIGVFFAPDGSDCDGVATPLVPFTIYVGAVLGGDAASAGISGAEFRLDGADPAWLATVTTSPVVAVAIGSPIGGGCNVALLGCRPGPFVPLYTIQFLSTAAITPHTFAILKHSSPIMAFFHCPLVTLCDANFTNLCVAGGQAFLNDPAHVCTVGVEQQAWSTVKSMFR